MMTEKEIQEYYRALYQIKYEDLYNYINCEEVSIDGKRYIYPTKCKEVKVNRKRYLLPTKKGRINYGRRNYHYRNL